MQQTSTSHSRTGRSGKSRSTSTSRSKQPDAVKLLTADHDEVEAMFKQFQKARDGGKKSELVRKICMALTVHAEIEEEIFYPAVREAIGEKDETVMDEAAIEHQSMKNLIADIEDAGEDDEMLQARMKVLCEYVMHHVKEEKKNIFPKAKKSRLDLAELGAELQARKMELMEDEQ